jgi:hypothetical protein
MRRFLTLVCVLGCYTATTHTSRRTTETFGDWSAPSNVASLNTSSNDEYAVLSRDGLTIYFTSDRPGSQIRPDGSLGLDLWFATRDSVDSPSWNTPQNMGSLINSAADDSLPFLSSNEHVLYFYSKRPGCGQGQGDIWMTRRRNKHSPWQEPTNLGCVLNTSFDETAPAFFEDPKTEQAWLFFGSNRPGTCPESCPNGIGDYDVYASPLGEDGSVGPGILVPEFSSPVRDTRIFIRKDGLEAFITSNRPGSLGVSPALDIWVSTRATLSDPWSVPTNLGNPVNSTVDDVAPWLSKDGTTLYFSSNRLLGGFGMRDIWYTTRMKLND